MKFRFFIVMVLMMAGRSAFADKAESVYASTSAGSLYQYRVGSKGALQPLTPASIKVASQAVMLALHPSGHYVYAVTIHEFRRGNNNAQVFGYRVGTAGALISLSSEPLTLDTAADNVTMDPKGRFLFVSGEGGRLFTFRVQPDGMLAPLADNNVEGTFGIDAQGDGGEESTGMYSQDVVALDASGRFLYLWANTGFVDHREYCFVPYRLDARGRLHPLARAAYGQGQNGACFSAAGGSVFVARYSLEEAGTYCYRSGARHALVPPSLPVIPHQFALALTTTAKKQTLWTTFSPSNALALYHVGPHGRITLKMVSAGKLPSIWASAADEAGHLFYVASSPHPTVQVFVPSYGTLPEASLPLDSDCISLAVSSRKN